MLVFEDELIIKCNGVTSQIALQIQNWSKPVLNDASANGGLVGIREACLQGCTHIRRLDLGFDRITVRRSCIGVGKREPHALNHVTCINDAWLQQILAARYLELRSAYNVPLSIHLCDCVRELNLELNAIWLAGTRQGLEIEVSNKWHIESMEWEFIKEELGVTLKEVETSVFYKPKYFIEAQAFSTNKEALVQRVMSVLNADSGNATFYFDKTDRALNVNCKKWESLQPEVKKELVHCIILTGNWETYGTTSKQLSEVDWDIIHAIHARYASFANELVYKEVQDIDVTAEAAAILGV